MIFDIIFYVVIYLILLFNIVVGIFESFKVKYRLDDNILINKLISNNENYYYYSSQEKTIFSNNILSDNICRFINW